MEAAEITVCDRWRYGEDGKSGFECFLADMGSRPLGHSIDRIEVNDNYDPGNCRWATKSEQQRNQRPYDRRHSEAARAKIGAASRGRTLTPESRAKIGAARRGKPLSAEHRAKIGSASVRRAATPPSFRGKKHSAETRAKMSAIAKGRTFLPETRAKIGLAKRGNKYRLGSTPSARVAGEDGRERSEARPASEESRSKCRCVYSAGLNLRRASE